ncbi:MAG: sulfur carrier protein ThiS [Pseudomonadota bacterium]
MTIFLNGAEIDVQSGTLDALITELGYGEARVATALNGDFVPKSQRAETAIAEGDRLEVLAPLQGG